MPANFFLVHSFCTIFQNCVAKWISLLSSYAEEWTDTVSDPSVWQRIEKKHLWWLWRKQQYVKKTATCEENSNMWRKQQYVKKRATCEENSNMWRKQQHVKKTAICEENSNMWSQRKLRFFLYPQGSKWNNWKRKY